MYLRKMKPRVYEVWEIDESGRLVRPVGMFGKFSDLCKYNYLYEHYAMTNVVGEWHWIFDSIYYESRLFNDYVSGYRYLRGLGSGA